MNIVFAEPEVPIDLRLLLFSEEFLKGTRFRLIHHPEHLQQRSLNKAYGKRFNSGVRIKGVRLIPSERKHFCGNHPGPCALSGHRPEKRHLYLEGADWVAFNDHLNDILDRMNYSCWVFSRPLEMTKPLWIRIGRKRRVTYFSEPSRAALLGFRANDVWQPGDEQSDFEDWCGKTCPPRAELADSTPGFNRLVPEAAALATV